MPELKTYTTPITTYDSFVDKAARDFIGDINRLDTADKSNLVSAVNELIHFGNFVISVTGDVDSGYEIDKTGAEITTAIEKKVPIFLLALTDSVSAVLPVSSIEDGEIHFSGVLEKDDRTLQNNVSILYSDDSASVDYISITNIAGVEWEEISNNPFVESEREVLPEQEIAITLQDAEAQKYGWMVTPATFSLIPGKTHRILWDGTEYLCTGQGEAGEVALGNLLYLTGDETMDTGEPFLFYVASFEENGETVSMGICATNDTEETTHRAQIWVTDKNPLLPSVSPADEGKLLQVVEGAWTPVWPDTEAGDAVPVHIDLSNYKTQGTIVETFADNSTKTTTVTFDSEGRPSTITDPNGNITTLNW